MTASDPMLNAYFRRIGFHGPLRSDLATLHAIHRAQAGTVPYEAIDVFAGTPVSLDLAAIQEKIIGRGRGGWCYETNGLLEWALTASGFEARRAVAAAYNHEFVPDSMGNHVVVLVNLDGEDWLCDLGLGDALRAPIPLREGYHRDGTLSFRLERLKDGLWRFSNHATGDPSNVILDPRPADETLLVRKHTSLLAEPESSFRLNFQVMQMGTTGSTVIYGRVLRRTSPEGVVKTLVSSPTHLNALLSDEFGLSNIDSRPFWPRILSRHAAIFGSPDGAPG